MYCALWNYLILDRIEVGILMTRKGKKYGITSFTSFKNDLKADNLQKVEFNDPDYQLKYRTKMDEAVLSRLMKPCMDCIC